MCRLVRAAFGVIAPGAARWLTFRPFFCFLRLLLLVTGFPAVGDLRQEFANMINLFLSPTMNAHSFSLDKLGRRNFTGCDIAAQGCRIKSELSGGLAGREEQVHSSASVADRKRQRKTAVIFASVIIFVCCCPRRN